VENHRFLLPDSARQIAAAHGTPCFVYDQATLEAQADAMLGFPNAYGVTVRFAMKACPNASVLKVFANKGLHFDASSGWEVRRALLAGVPADRISLSSQELPEDFPSLLSKGVHVNACSLLQLERIGKALPGHEVGLRFNPGRGSGGTGKTNVGGPDSSFGIWHEWADQAQAIVKQYGLKVVRIHTHIGSGSDPVVWQEVSAASLALVSRFPTVQTLNLGGGYKVARVAAEKGTDPQVVGAPVKVAFEKFAEEARLQPMDTLRAAFGAVERPHDDPRRGNRLEVFLDMPWYCEQPLREPIDLDQSDEAVMAAAEALARSRPKFRSRAEWLKEMQQLMGYQA
jgi:diaminopimelate decarboxylase